MITFLLNRSRVCAYLCGMVRIGARVFIFSPDDIWSPNVVGTVIAASDRVGHWKVRADGGETYECSPKTMRVIAEPDDVMATVAWHLEQLRARAEEQENILAQEIFSCVYDVMLEEGIDGDRIFRLAHARREDYRSSKQGGSA